MSFEDLPPLPPLLQPGATEYAERIAALSRAAMASCDVRLDLPYGPDYWQKVDIYLPKTAARGAALPVLCFIHGGAWVNGCKEWLGFMAPSLIEAPMIFVSISHRLAPATRMPDIVDDCLDATAWVYKNIGTCGGDPDRISIGGHSAGAQLASLVALRRDLLEQRGLPRDAIKACLPISGSYDFRFTDPVPGTMEHRILHQIMRDPKDAWEFSPLRYIEGNDTPFYVAWGEHDFPRVARQGASFIPLLAAQSAIVGHAVYSGYDHFTVHENCAEPGSAWAQVARRWARGDFH
jgi:acetyl esterase/lipase